MASTKKKTPTTKFLDVPIYDCGLVVTNDYEHGSRYLKRKFGIEVEYHPCAGCVLEFCCQATGSKIVVLYLNNASLQVLAHESVHAAWAVLNGVGAKVSYKNQEPLAYLTDWVFEKTRTALKVK